jgi:hypothetical protein
LPGREGKEKGLEGRRGGSREARQEDRRERGRERWSGGRAGEQWRFQISIYGSIAKKKI